MLTARALGHGRRHALLAAVRPTARQSHLGMVVLTLGAASIPLAVVVGRGGEVGMQLLVAALVAGAAVGFVVDDPTADLLAPTPIAAPTRLTLRLGAVAAVVALGMALTVLGLQLGPGVPADLGDRLPEALAASALALAVGLVGVRQGAQAIGPVAVMAGTLGPAVVAALAVRWSTVLPTLASGPLHDRWWWVAGAGAAVALHAARDPGRR